MSYQVEVYGGPDSPIVVTGADSVQLIWPGDVYVINRPKTALVSMTNVSVACHRLGWAT